MQDVHCFELYGYDILLDSELKPWLLEVNASPSLTPSSQDDFEMKFRVLNHMLDILDLEKVRTGNETTVEGFDMLIKNNEIIYKPESPANNFISKDGTIPGFFQPSMNIRIGKIYSLSQNSSLFQGTMWHPCKCHKNNPQKGDSVIRSQQGIFSDGEMNASLSLFLLLTDRGRTGPRFLQVWNSIHSTKKPRAPFKIIRISSFNLFIIFIINFKKVKK